MYRGFSGDGFIADKTGMSQVGSPLGTSVLQTVVAQQTANKARERERAASDAARRFQDIVELRVSGVESADAIRPLPQNDSEQARDEHEAEDPESRKALADAKRIDVTG